MAGRRKGTWDVRTYKTERNARKRLAQVQALQPTWNLAIVPNYDFRYAIARFSAAGEFMGLCT